MSDAGKSLCGTSRLHRYSQASFRARSVNQLLYLWNQIILVNTILTYLGDRMEMAHSVEGRVPFLDHHVAEYAAGLPIRHKIRGTRAA
ncbi:MAG: asparagine synthase-related protein [Methylocella sp.]